MEDKKLKQFETAVYSLIVLGAIILILLGSYVWQTGTVNNLLLSMATNLLAAGVLFFVIQKLFSIGDNNSNEDSKKITEELKEYKGVINQILDDTIQIKNVTAKIEGVKLDVELNDIRSKVTSGHIYISEQQSTTLNRVLKELEKIKSAAILSDGEIVVQALGAIRKTLITVEGDISNLTKKISTEVENQQDQLLKRIERKFNDSVAESHNNTHEAIKRELAALSQNPENYHIAAERIARFFDHSLITMGVAQREFLKKEYLDAFNPVLQSIRHSMDNLASKVEAVQETTRRALPPAPENS